MMVDYVEPGSSREEARAAAWAEAEADRLEVVAARAIETMVGAGVGEVSARVAADALIAAGLLGPSPLDRMVAEMDALGVTGPCLWRRDDGEHADVWRAQVGCYGFGESAQDAAEMVLMRRMVEP